MESFVSEAPQIPFVSYCVVCNVFLTMDELVYEKGQVFHRTCFDEHGKEFPDINYDQINQNSEAKVQLVKLRNLKVRQLEALEKLSTKSKPKTKRKSKSKRKKPKRKAGQKRKSSSKKKRVKKSPRKKKSAVRRRPKPKKRKKSGKTRKRIRRKPTRRRAKKRKRR